MTAAEPVS